MLQLTEMEKKVLKAMIESSDGNGHDFGFIEDLRGVVPVASLGGVVASLSKKGIVTVFEPHRTDSGLWTQFQIDSLYNKTQAEVDAALAALTKACESKTCVYCDRVIEDNENYNLDDSGIYCDDCE